MDTNRPSGSRTKLVRSPSEAMLVTPSAVLDSCRSTRVPSCTSVTPRIWVWSVVS